MLVSDLSTQSTDNSSSLHFKTHDRNYYDSLVKHTSSVCGDNSLVTLQKDHEFDNLENRPPGEIFEASLSKLVIRVFRCSVDWLQHSTFSLCSLL